MAGKVHWRRLETLLFFFFFFPATLSRLDNLDRISAQDRSVFVDLLTVTERSRRCGLNASDRLSREVFRQNANKQVTVGLQLMLDNDLV